MGYILFALSLGLWALLLHRRNRRLRRLSEDLDHLLHDGTPLPISQYREGELSILATQLQKVTLRLLESAERSRSDKKALADSLADISHQLRTPLTTMNLTATMLSAAELSPSRRQELTAELRNLLHQTHWLVETLLKLSKLDAGTVTFAREEISVQQLLRHALAPLAVPMDLRDQRTELCCAEERLVGDLRWTAEALGNVLKNCMEHSPTGGTITVNAEETALYTAITVEDTGEGFSPEELPHLFERFYKGEHSTGYGIGLALARTIIAAQNGTIRAMNTPRGAKFEIRFYKTVV
ncbi:MAG: HAMP domain-containing histidine kinase [Oscillospiraceae bacterium]|nr:HAMP domain-containing histidine kinase [Oscillospiraceae bacterium]